MSYHVLAVIQGQQLARRYQWVGQGFRNSVQCAMHAVTVIFHQRIAIQGGRRRYASAATCPLRLRPQRTRRWVRMASRVASFSFYFH